MTSTNTKSVSYQNPDHSLELSRLHKISGQLQGIEKMIYERRYCPEIIQQIRAAKSALKALETTILTKHLDQSLKEAGLSRKSEGFQRTITEIVRLIKG